MTTDAHPLHGIVFHCADNQGMAAWNRLAEHILNRRIQLGYQKRPALAEASGISLRTLSDIENARRTSYERNTIVALEQTLRWAPGSITAILDNGEPSILAEHPTTPTAQPPSAGDDTLIQIMNRPDLTDQQKARIMRTLIGEQERFARQRADELIRAALGAAPPSAG
jgi:transcriptional regulator with XRE-family HTH domain